MCLTNKWLFVTLALVFGLFFLSGCVFSGEHGKNAKVGIVWKLDTGLWLQSEDISGEYTGELLVPEPDDEEPTDDEEPVDENGQPD